jgi:para-nitrobenzyl esterase
MHSMTSYWANFAYTGDPGRGRDGKEPEWQPWGGTTGSEPAFILLDTAKGGGIRMSSEGVTREALVARVVTDPRFESWQERCELYYGFVEWSGGMTRDEYTTIGDGACAEFPLAEYSR